MKQYLEKWLEEVYKPSVKPLSYQNYRSVVRVHLIPSLGHIPLQKLAVADVQSLYARKLNEGYKPRMVVLIHSALHRALENAVKWGLVARNVAKLATLPHVARYEAKTLTAQQVRTLLDTARGNRFEVVLILAVATGMRRGELLALHWDDIDFVQSSVFVHRTLSRIIRQGCKETEPKTRAGRRVIVLPAMVVGALQKHQMEQEKKRIEAGEKWVGHGLVFCTNCGDYIIPDYADRELHKLLVAAGLPDIRFHDLRHSAATMLLVAGVHPKVVQERLGHSTIAMTMDTYSHVVPSMQQEAAKKIDDMLNGS